ncbi:MAG: hypothetical protein CMJ59_19710 [Planctomycetaceae bacterium]|nr:hypothetical protein [Planctomycetaceae bacterium]
MSREVATSPRVVTARHEDAGLRCVLKPVTRGTRATGRVVTQRTFCGSLGAFDEVIGYIARALM